MTRLEQLIAQRRAQAVRVANASLHKRPREMDLYRKVNELVEREEERLDDMIAQWHAKGGAGVELHEFLGLTAAEFHRFVGCTSCLSPALAIRGTRSPATCAPEGAGPGDDAPPGSSYPRPSQVSVRS